MSPRQTIDRKDWRKGYCPENCRWATRSEQNKNRRMTEAWLEACRRNWLRALAAQKAKRGKRGGAWVDETAAPTCTTPDEGLTSRAP